MLDGSCVRERRLIVGFRFNKERVFASACAGVLVNPSVRSVAGGHLRGPRVAVIDLRQGT
jgi:hypothetical protein